MVPQSFREIFDNMYDRTVAGEANWRTTADESVFALHLTEFSLTMRSGHERSDGTDFIRWDVVNAEGKAIDGFYIDDSESEWRKAEDLYQSARRKALRLDVALDEILNELQRGGPVGLDKKPSSSPFDDDDLPF